MDVFSPDTISINISEINPNETQNNQIKVTLTEDENKIKLNFDQNEVEQLQNPKIQNLQTSEKTPNLTPYSMTPNDSPSQSPSTSPNPSPTASPNVMSKTKKSSSSGKVMNFSIDKEAIKPALEEILNNKKRWYILHYDDEGKVYLGESGETDDLDSYKDRLQDNSVSYVILKKSIPNENVDKTLFIFWAHWGTKIKVVQRGKFTHHKQQVYDFCQQSLQLCGEFQPLNRDDLNEEKVLSKVRAQQGKLSTEKPKILKSRSASMFVMSGSNNSSPSRSPSRSPLLERKMTFGLSDKSLVKGQGTVSIDDEEKAVALFLELRDFSNELDWIKLGYEGKNKKVLQILDSGKNGLEEISTKTDEKEICYFLLKGFVSSTKQGVSSQDKYALITWMGKKLKASQRIGGSHGAMLKTTISGILHITVELTIDTIQDLNNEHIFGKESLKKQEGVKLLSQQPATQKKRSGTLMKTEFKIHESDNVKQELSQFKDEENKLTWLLFSDEDHDCKLIKKGEKDIKEFEDLLLEDKVYYVLYKLIIEGTPKVILISWIPEKASSFAKVTSASNRNLLSQFVLKEMTLAGEYQATNKAELTEELIKSKVIGSSGKEIDADSLSPRTKLKLKLGIEPLDSFEEKRKLRLKSRSFINQSPTGSPSGTPSGSPKISPRRKALLSGVISPRKLFIKKSDFSQIQDDLKLVDPETTIKELKNLNNDKSEEPKDFILFGYKDRENLDILAIGNNGIEGMKPFLDEKEVRYAVYKTIGSSSYGGSLKIVLLTFVGTKAGIFHKGKSSSTRQLLFAFSNTFMSLVGEYYFTTVEELDDEKILQKLNASVSDLKTTKTEGSPIKKFGGQDFSLNYGEPEEMNAAFEQLAAPKSELKWLIFEYENDEYTSVKVVQKGSGGVKAIKPHLSQEKVSYILMRISFMEYYDIAKAILITVVGNECPHFLKALSSGHRQLLYNFAKTKISVAGEYQPDSLDNFTDQDLSAKLTGTQENNYRDAVEEDKNLHRSYSQIKSFTIKDVHSFTGGGAKEVEFNGKDEMLKAVTEMKENDQIEYLAFKVEGKTCRDLQYIQSDFKLHSDEWNEKFLDPEGNYYFIIAVKSSEIGYGMVTKYVLVIWNGANVKPMKKSKSSEVRFSIYSLVNGILQISSQMFASKPEDCSKDSLLEKITGSSLRGNEMDLKEKQEKYKDLGKQKTELKFKDLKEIQDTIEQITEETDEVDFLMVKYVPDTIDEIELFKKGNGGLDEMKQYLKDDEVCFIVLRVMHAFGYVKDLEGAAKPYYGIIQWQGEKITVLEKAMSSHHFNAFSKTARRKFDRLQLSVSGGHLHCEKLEEFNLDNLKKTMRLFD
eukprot:gene4633-8206_t